MRRLAEQIRAKAAAQAPRLPASWPDMRMPTEVEVHDLVDRTYRTYPFIERGTRTRG